MKYLHIAPRLTHYRRIISIVNANFRPRLDLLKSVQGIPGGWRGVAIYRDGVAASFFSAPAASLQLFCQPPRRRVSAPPLLLCAPSPRRHDELLLRLGVASRLPLLESCRELSDTGPSGSFLALARLFEKPFIRDFVLLRLLRAPHRESCRPQGDQMSGADSPPPPWPIRALRCVVPICRASSSGATITATTKTVTIPAPIPTFRTRWSFSFSAMT